MRVLARIETSGWLSYLLSSDIPNSSGSEEEQGGLMALEEEEKNSLFLIFSSPKILEQISKTLTQEEKRLLYAYLPRMAAQPQDLMPKTIAQRSLNDLFFFP